MREIKNAKPNPRRGETHRSGKEGLRLERGARVAAGTERTLTPTLSRSTGRGSQRRGSTRITARGSGSASQNKKTKAARAASAFRKEIKAPSQAASFRTSL